jgi:PPOX class probable F420-dependent enzyme
MTDLDGERYISLETFRKDGSGVKTPVWAAPLDGKLVVVTDGNSYKVKRLRANPRCRIAGCDARGKKVHTPWKDATCRILERPEENARAHRALKEKYGWQFALLDAASWISRAMRHRVFLELSA